jgi:hypothetical protein
LSIQDTPYLILDVGCDFHRPVMQELREMAQQTYIIVDTDIPSMEWFNGNPLDEEFQPIHFMLEEPSVHLIANQYVDEAKDLLKDLSYYSIPSIPKETIFHSQYQGTFDLIGREWAKKIEQFMNPILKDLIPSSLQSKKMKKRFFPKIGKPSLSVKDSMSEENAT